MIRPVLAIAAGLALALVAAVPARAAGTAQVAGTASATVVRPLQVIALADMDFGTITHAWGQAGSVTVAADGAGASFDGGVSAVCAGAGCDAHPARFAVSGEPDRSYAIQIPGTIVAKGEATDPGASAPPLVVESLTLRRQGGDSAPRLDARGTDAFAIGGTLALPGNCPPAHYRASFAVIVSYI